MLHSSPCCISLLHLSQMNRLCILQHLQYSCCNSWPCSQWRKQIQACLSFSSTVSVTETVSEGNNIIIIIISLSGCPFYVVETAKSQFAHDLITAIPTQRKTTHPVWTKLETTLTVPSRISLVSYRIVDDGLRGGKDGQVLVGGVGRVHRHRSAGACRLRFVRPRWSRSDRLGVRFHRGDDRMDIWARQRRIPQPGGHGRIPRHPQDQLHSVTTRRHCYNQHVKLQNVKQHHRHETMTKTDTNQSQQITYSSMNVDSLVLPDSTRLARGRTVHFNDFFPVSVNFDLRPWHSNLAYIVSSELRSWIIIDYHVLGIF